MIGGLFGSGHFWRIRPQFDHNMPFMAYYRVLTVVGWRSLTSIMLWIRWMTPIGYLIINMGPDCSVIGFIIGFPTPNEDQRGFLTINLNLLFIGIHLVFGWMKKPFSLEIRGV